MIAVLIVLPVIPILITSLIIAIVMRFTNFIKNKNKVMYIAIILTIFLVGIVTSMFTSTDTLSKTAITEIILKTNGVAEKIADYFILIKPIMNTLLNYNNINGLKNLIIYVIENIVCYILVINIIAKIYLKGAIGVTINSSKKEITDTKLKLSDFKNNNKNITYLKKEYKILSRTPIFFIQCILIPIIYPISIFLIILALVAFANWVGLDLLNILKNIAITSRGFAIFIGVGQVFFMMNFTSIISISKESKNAIITKYIPMDLMKQFNLKVLFGILTNVVSIILVTAFYYICTKDILIAIALMFILLEINIFGEKIKLLIDFNKPQLSWDSEYTMMKQNTNVMYELFYTLVLAIIIFGISEIFNNITIFMIAIFIIFLICNIILSNYIKKNNYKIFGKIY
jgi:ABC-2 type transport system permease protein